MTARKTTAVTAGNGNSERSDGLYSYSSDGSYNYISDGW